MRWAAQKKKEGTKKRGGTRCHVRPTKKNEGEKKGTPLAPIGREQAVRSLETGDSRIKKRKANAS